MGVDGTRAEHGAAIGVDIEGFVAIDGELGGCLGMIAQGDRCRVTDASAADRGQLFVQRARLCFGRSGDSENVTVDEFGDLPFERKDDASGGHDEDEQTGCYSNNEMQPEDSFANHLSPG